MEDAATSIRASDDVAVDDVRPATAKLFNATHGDADFDVPVVVVWSPCAGTTVSFESAVSSHAACSDVQVVLFASGCDGRGSGRIDRWNGSAATDGFDVADVRVIPSTGAADGTGATTGAEATSGEDDGAVSTGIGADVAAATA